MKYLKKNLLAVFAVLFAYVYTYTGERGFEIETFCVLFVFVIYIVWFLGFLDKLFSR